MFDTHVHTCLSPCGELDMHPAALVEASVEAGLDAVVVCDHNAAGNVAAVERADERGDGGDPRDGSHERGRGPRGCAASRRGSSAGAPITGPAGASRHERCGRLRHAGDRERACRSLGVRRASPRRRHDPGSRRRGGQHPRGWRTGGGRSRGSGRLRHHRPARDHSGGLGARRAGGVDAHTHERGAVEIRRGQFRPASPVPTHTSRIRWAAA